MTSAGAQLFLAERRGSVVHSLKGYREMPGFPGHGSCSMIGLVGYPIRFNGLSLLGRARLVFRVGAAPALVRLP